MNTTLVPKEGLTAEDSELMLALNQAVISLIDDPRPVFQLSNEQNAGNLSLAARLRANPSRLVQYEFGNMPDFNNRLWLNVYFTLTFNDIKSNWNEESGWNCFHLTPKQTTEVLRRVTSSLALPRVQQYAIAVAEQIEEAARQTAADARTRINPYGDSKLETVLDQATSSFFASCYSTAQLVSTRRFLKTCQDFVMRFSR